MNEPQRFLVAAFKGGGRAKRAVRELLKAGFTEQEVGLAFRLIDAAKAASHVAGLPAQTTEAPGIGPVTGAGLLAAGWQSIPLESVARNLAAVGIPEEEARYCQEQLERLQVVVIVKARERYSEALAILCTYGSTEIVRELAS